MQTDQVIARAGGVQAVAAALGVDRTTVLKWRTRGLPVLRVPEIARLAKVQPHELRPDLWEPPATQHTASGAEASA